MGKNQSASNLPNIIQSSNGSINFVSGSTLLMQISSSGAITTTGVISGSNALSSSYAVNADQLDGFDSTAFVFTSSFNTYSSSMSTRVSNTESTGSTLTTASASFAVVSSSYSTSSGSLSTRVTTLEAASASLNTASGSFSTRTTTLEQASASLNTASGSFSNRVTKIEGNYATTGSNIFTGAQTVCANITSTGTIIAQTLNVQQVTSSVVYSSGSNVFGCSLANTQQFTGSVTITGSLVVTTTAPELTVGATGVTLGNVITDIHNITGSLRTTGSITGVGNACFTSVCSPSYTGGAFSGTTIAGTTLYGSTAVCAPTICGGNVCGTTGCFGTTCSPSYLGGTFSGTTISGTTLYGSTAVCAPTICGGNVCGTVGCFVSVCSPTHIGGTFSGTTVSGTTLYGSTAICAPTILGTTIVSGSVGCFISICSPTYIGGTYSGTTNYASTVACSPVGCFTTSCASSFVGGTASGTTIFASTTFCGPSICTIDSRACTLRMACTIVPLSNYRTSDCGYGGIDFFDNGKGYACSAKFYTFKSVTSAEYYGFTNDYNGSAQLAAVSCGGGGGENISFFTGTSTTARLRIDSSASTFSQTVCSPTVIGSSIVCSAASVYAATNIRLGSGTSAGNASDPGITTGGCTKTGIYFAGSCVALGSGGNSLLLAQNGNVGIGTSTPETALQIAKTGTDDQLTLGSTATNRDIAMYMYSGTTKAEVLRYQSSLNLIVGASANITNVRFNNGGTTRLIIEQAYSCFQNTLCTPSGHRFGNGSTTLNYYEEGSWTPVFGGLTVGGTTSYAHRSGTYVRIGNWVLVRWGFKLSSTSGAIGTMSISGLPFAPANYGSYQEPNVSVSTGLLATADYAQRARVFVQGPNTVLEGRIANNADTAWNVNEFSGDEWIIGEVFYNT